MISLQNQRLLARIAQRMLEPSQIDNHYTWERTSLVILIHSLIHSFIHPSIHHVFNES